MKIDRDNISRLLIRYFQEKLTPDEQDALEVWIHEKKERQQLVDELDDKAKQEEYLRLYRSFDLGKAWEKVVAACRRQSLIVRLRYVKIAAILFLCLGTAFFSLYRISGTDEIGPDYPMSQIRPGTTRAVLVLENGEEKVLLDDRPREEAIQGKGWKVKCPGQLCYNVQQELKDVREAWHTLKVPVGGEYTLFLKDGTQIQLNSESELKYPVCFGEKSRKVILSGQAYFKVAKDTTRPFIVETDHMDIRVCGTSFDVMAYSGETSFHTTLVEGRVEVTGKNEGDKPLVLNPGGQAVFKQGVLTVREVDTDLYTAWIRGRFAFKGEELEEVLRKLERWYNVQFSIREETIRKKRFTGNVSRYEDITRILGMLELTTDIRFRISGNIIIVDKINEKR